MALRTCRTRSEDTSVCSKQRLYPCGVSPLGLRGHFEVAVRSVALLLVPVLQLDAELVWAGGGEGMERRVPQPVLSLRAPKSLSVFLPGPVEIQQTVLPSLDHRPPTTSCLHVTLSLGQTQQ